ncbi:MAG: T9SS type A sorting domain-containing protein [bacterium]|nr:T9SS type A sorting domain-containing protein [bacterium]
MISRTQAPAADAKRLTRHGRRYTGFYRRLFGAWLIGMITTGTALGSTPLPIRSQALDEGSPLAIALHDGLALVGAGTRLLVLDASVANTLDTLGKVVTGGEIRAIQVHGHHVFLANGEAGVTIVDIDVPDQPQFVGSIQTQTRVFDLHIDGNTLFIADKGSGLDIYDISTPVAPRFLSHYHMFDGEESGLGLLCVSASNGRAYLGDLHNRSIVNVENPTQPSLVSRVVGAAWDIQIQDTILYLTSNDTERFLTFSIANPDTLLPLDWISATPRYNGSAATLEFSLSGQRAYIGCEQAGLNIVDVSNPRDLRYVTDFDPDEIEPDVHGVAATDSVVYFVSYPHGVFGFIPTDTGDVEAALIYEASNSPLQITSIGSRLFVANYYRGLTEVDLQDVGRPVPTWSLRDHGSFSYTDGLATFQKDSLTYVITCDNDGGFRILDVTNEEQPVVTSETPMNNTKAVAVMGNYAYICAGDNVWVVDISSVYNTSIVTSVYVGVSPVNIDAQNDFVYVATNERGLTILDVHNPHAPTIAATYRQGAVSDVDAVYPRAYVTVRDSGLTVLDISILPPQRLGHLPWPGQTYAVEVVENLAFVATGHDGLRVYDVARPDSMYEVAYRDSIGNLGYLNIADNSTEYELRRTACLSMINGGVIFIDVAGLFDASRTSLILAGGGNSPDNFEYFAANTNASCNFAYSVLARNRDYGHNVAYMTPQSWQDLDGDGRDDEIVTSDVITPANLRQQILNLRDSQNPDKPNVFHFSGHGHYNEIDLTGNPRDNVTADSLGAWLDRAALDETTKLVILIEACNAGSLIEELNNGRSNRIFIASGGANEACSFFGHESFSTKFWEYVWDGQSVWQAFSAARGWINERDSGQNPLLDANGNGDPLEVQDRIIADDVFIGGRVQDGATLPVILDSPIGVDAFGDTTTVEIRCSGAMENVWYRIYPYGDVDEPGQFPWGTMAAVSYDRYRATLSGLSALSNRANYVIEFNALDDLTNLALPRTAILRIDGGPPPPVPPPDAFELVSYPNPFNTNVRIAFRINNRAPVTIDVWNVLGQRAATLLNETLEPGVHTVNWAGANAAGVSLSSGLYFVRLHTEGNFAASKLLLIR